MSKQAVCAEKGCEETIEDGVQGMAHCKKHAHQPCRECDGSGGYTRLPPWLPEGAEGLWVPCGKCEGDEI